MRSPLLSLLLVGPLALSGCAAATPAPTADPTAAASAEASTEAGAECDGIGVIVDFGTLGGEGASDCVDTGSAIAATAALDEAGVTTEGSVEWGDQIVCRVDERPGPDETVEVAGESSFVESCQSMPPAYAYWALWVKPSAEAEWEYAQEGLGTLQLEPGQSVGLVYTTGTETPTPAG
ncbi:hypothetical protein BJY17_000416 [Agromyces hippuratus]|uniref:Uncharacterized protein n=1 Tax=Agromyces hippuratus TaxID=286438 RepID=A0A852WP12_9MICO|nr:hypothetical protein [Agromyces hippuratus]NYG19669.1 hypothetical protein [Agromyces hippuratus]